MKSLLLCACMLVSMVGCGGYGSGGMGTTPAPAPNFTPPGGTYNGPQLMVTMSDSLQGATIYFTTDGSTPTLNSPVYQGPIAITKNTRVEAIAFANGYS